MTATEANEGFALEIDPEQPHPRLAGGVFAIGNFDGVHLGHRAVIERTRAIAEARGRPSAALTFEPHPADYFAGRPVVFRLTPFEEKMRALRSLGLDGAVMLNFNAALAGLSAEEFVARILVGALAIGGAVVGADFHFGKGRSGSPAFLAESGQRHGFQVEILEKIERGPHGDKEAISSTQIRRLLEHGDVEGAAERLGRPYEVSGVVIRGQQLGRTLGMPTANLAVPETNRLRYGVYAVRATVEGVRYHAVASFGVRPTVDGREPLLETYLFDFSGDLYGRELCVEFVARIRDELKFESLEALKDEMARDGERARAVLGAR